MTIYIIIFFVLFYCVSFSIGICRYTALDEHRPRKSYYGLLRDQKYPQGIIPKDGIIVSVGLTGL